MPGSIIRHGSITDGAQARRRCCVRERISFASKYRLRPVMSVTSRLSTLPSIAVKAFASVACLTIAGLRPCWPLSAEQFFDQIALFRDSGFAQFARASVEARERLVCGRAAISSANALLILRAAATARAEAEMKWLNAARRVVGGGLSCSEAQEV